MVELLERLRSLLDDLKITEENSESLLGIPFVNGPKIIKSTNDNGEDTGLLIGRFTKADAGPRKKSEALDERIKCLEWIGNEMKKVQKAVSESIPFPQEYEQYEFICMVLLNTLVYDRWYENKEITSHRSSGVQYSFVLWKLQMSYRLWQRIPEILINGTSPMYYPSAYFEHPLFNDGYYTLPRGSIDIPIASWDLERLGNALTLLSVERCDHKRLQLITEKEHGRYSEYKVALLDRLAVATFYGQCGPIEKIVTINLGWARILRRGEKEIEASSSEVEIVDNPNADAQKEIIRIHNAQAAENAKRVNLVRREDEKPKAKERPVSETVRERLDYLKKNGIDQIEYEMHEQLSRLHLKYDVIKDAMGDDDDTDDLEFLDKIALQVQVIEMNILEIQENKRKVGEKEAEKSIQDLLRDLNASNNASRRDVFQPTLLWFKDISMLSHHICTWQLQTKLRIDTSSPLHCELKDVILRTVVELMKRIDNTTLMEHATKWIIEKRLQFWERERYRSRVSVKAKFKGIDAWKYCQTDLNTDKPLPDFPDRIDILLHAGPDNHYFYDGWAFACHWWLAQSYSNIGVDQLFFYWEIEYEYLSLTRKTLKSKVITKLGSNWCIFIPPKWDDENGEWINCIWCGHNLLDCMVEYFKLIAIDGWKVEHRYSGIKCDLKNTPIHLLLDPILQKYSNN